MALFKTFNAYDQFLEYLATKVTPADILAFQASPQEQERLNILTEKNKSSVLTADESAELDEMLAFNRLMTLLKTRAYVAHNTSSIFHI
jgi:hypothetical protein